MAQIEHQLEGSTNLILPHFLFFVSYKQNKTKQKTKLYNPRITPSGKKETLAKRRRKKEKTPLIVET
jgi:hypothetical protein